MNWRWKDTRFIVLFMLITGILVAAVLLTTGSDSLPKKAMAANQLCYQVSAVNAVGEGPRSNELCVDLTRINLFHTFLYQLQKTTPYANWVKANPADAARWTTYVQSTTFPINPPLMSTAFGKALVDAAALVP